MNAQEQFIQDQNQAELNSISGRPKNIQIAALKTIEAYKEAYRDKGIVPTSKDDYPRSDVGYRQVQRLLKFDSIAKKDKGIKKVIRSMVIVLAPHAFAGGDKCISVKGQPFNVCNKDKRNPALSGESKKQCREELDKCSSSQTGYGDHHNPKP